MSILIIGIDGATFDLVRPWATAGELPNLARLLASGVQANLASTMPPVTSPAWPTFMTGCNPGKHGVFDFIQPKGSQFSLVNATRIKQPTIWQRLSAAGLRVGVLNVPVTFPPRPMNGFMVTDFLSPRGGQICYPADLISRYEGRLGGYRIAPNVQYKQGNEEAYIADIYDLIRAHGEWGLALMEGERWDVLMVHFIALDIMKHALWRFMDSSHPRHVESPYRHAIRDGYKLVDGYVGQMLDRLSPADTVLVMSDHGFGPLRAMVNLNNYFMKKGLLKLRRDPLTRLKAAAFNRGITPAGVYRLIEKIGLQNLATLVSRNTRNQVVGRFLSFDSVDWRQTIAYSMGHMGQVYLNVAGREPQGIVTEANYEQRRQQVVDALMGLRDEDGRYLVSQIILREEVYHGPYSHAGPDIHLVLDNYQMIAFPLFATNEKIITGQIRGDSGCHRREGILIAAGPGIRPQVALPEANILDLAPTILHLAGQPVPRVMDGRVLTEMFTEPQPVSFDDELQPALPADQALSPAETAEVEERLRSLGYL
jgi:predicted AlkP superfamily phosphohydrolase/phosphomutase